MTKRSFIPGSEWLYLKLYLGKIISDTVLTKWLLPLFDTLSLSQNVSEMFFLRYTDPDYHLRIRLHIPDLTKFGHIVEIISQTIQPYVDSGIIWKIDIGTYQRELERYGEDNIEIIEKIFSCDSIYTLKILDSVSSSDRWKISCLFISQLFECLNYSIERIISVMDDMQRSFRNEVGLMSSTNRQQLNEKYRTLRSELERLICTPSHDEHYMALSNILVPEVKIKIDCCVPDIIHIINNRIFIDYPRQNEAVLYYLLYKSYQSIYSRKNENNH